MHLYNKQDWSLLKFTCNFDIIGINQNIVCVLRLFLNLFIVFVLLDIGAWGTFTITDEVLKKVEARYGADALKRVTEMSQLINSLQDSSIELQLKRVNDFFNRVDFVSDQENWQQEDYWATPVEFLASGGGDCEDFSIAKYFTLKALGIDEKKLSLTYVKAIELDQAHMVLTYYPTPTADPLVLDNLVQEIKPASKRPDLLPVYSFNGSGLWLAKERGRGKQVGSSKQINHWQNLLERIEIPIN